YLDSHSFPTRRSSDLSGATVLLTTTTWYSFFSANDLPICSETFLIYDKSMSSFFLLGVPTAIKVIWLWAIALGKSVVAEKSFFRSEEHTSELQSPCNL